MFWHAIRRDNSQPIPQFLTDPGWLHVPDGPRLRHTAAATADPAPAAVSHVRREIVIARYPNFRSGASRCKDLTTLLSKSRIRVTANNGKK